MSLKSSSTIPPTSPLCLISDVPLSDQLSNGLNVLTPHTHTHYPKFKPSPFPPPTSVSPRLVCKQANQLSHWNHPGHWNLVKPTQEVPSLASQLRNPRSRHLGSSLRQQHSGQSQMPPVGAGKVRGIEITITIACTMCARRKKPPRPPNLSDRIRYYPMSHEATNVQGDEWGA